MSLKRAFDVAAASATLIGLAPAFAAIATWIKLDSPGPVLFRQERVGRCGKPFHILKFRTMRVDAEQSGLQLTVGADRRITRSGQVLRRYKLDELPQFVNVLLGDMSIVGPRPEVPRYVEHYPVAVRRVVLSVRPGITDRASIEYRDENRLLGESADPEQTYLREVLPVKLRYYEDYVRNRSFVGDLRLIIRTAAVVFRSR
jgi:lipopolysaccharide/colanic/teichoic acid biosynthesis glycosyltransferase